jgi:hypothetical protein
MWKENPLECLCLTPRDEGQRETAQVLRIEDNSREQRNTIPNLQRPSSDRTQQNVEVHFLLPSPCLPACIKGTKLIDAVTRCGPTFVHPIHTKEKKMNTFSSGTGQQFLPHDEHFYIAKDKSL